MKLLNNTSVPSDVLEAVLLRAARSIGGVKTAETIVQVNRGRSGVRGIAYDVCWVRWAVGRTRRKRTCSGAFRITLPTWGDPLKTAESFFRVARHEWGHIRDYQYGRYKLAWSTRGSGKRRPAHDSRPEEIRAENYCDDADRRKRGAEWAQEEIIALGLAIEVTVRTKERTT